MPQKNLELIKEIVIKAGELALKYQKDISKLDIKQKDKAWDFVTKADLECENLIKKELNKHFKGFSFLAEESGEEKTDSDYRWIIDPIDGTTDYINEMKDYSCCVCLQEKGQTVASVVYFPALDELYSASRDKDGAFLEFPHNEKKHKIKLDCSKKIQLQKSLIIYGLGHSNFNETNKIMGKLLPKISGLRIPGSASFGITKVAKCNFGAFIKYKIKKHDLYPAGYIAEKAGAVIYDLKGQKIKNNPDYDPEKDGCIIANKSIIKEISELTNPTFETHIDTAKEIYTEKITPLANKVVETSTPYVADGYNKTKPYLKKSWGITKKIFKDIIKPASKKAVELSIKFYNKTRPIVIKIAIGIKNICVNIFEKIKEKRRKKTKY